MGRKGVSGTLDTPPGGRQFETESIRYNAGRTSVYASPPPQPPIHRSSASSSSGSSAGSDIAVDGGSEDELRPRAEVRALLQLVARTKVEEREFRAARQQLTTVDLRPPKSRNPNMTRPRAAPRRAWI